MNYTVVIVTYNRLELLKECIDSIVNQEKQFDHIVIVDNASTDGTRDYLRKYEGNFHIIYQGENGGGAKGFKDGVEYVFNNVSTDWILLIDDDAILAPNYLQSISEFLYDNREYRAVSGTVITDGKIDTSHRKRLKSKLMFTPEAVPIDEYKMKSFEYDFSSFCGLLFLKDLIGEIGLPKEEYFIWYDDSEYSLRLRKKTKISNVNSAHINHKTKKVENNRKLNWKGYYGIRNMGDIVRLYGTKMQYHLYRLRVRMALLKNMILFVLKRDMSYKYNYTLYKDALDDMKNRVFGFNDKYHA